MSEGDAKLQACWSNLLNKSVEFSQKIAPLFEANNWTWVHHDGSYPPNPEQIESLIYALAWEAYKHAPNACSSGRLKVSFRKHQFVPDRWIGLIELVPVSVEV